MSTDTLKMAAGAVIGLYVLAKAVPGLTGLPAKALAYLKSAASHQAPAAGGGTQEEQSYFAAIQVIHAHLCKQGVPEAECGALCAGLLSHALVPMKETP